MPKEPLSEDHARRIRNLKRQYWAQDGIAKEYQWCAYKPEPLTRAKNLVDLGFVTRYITGTRVLDAGAGTGRFTLPLLTRGAAAIPLDISADMLKEGRRRAGRDDAGFPAVRGDLECLPFGDEAFDSVVSMTVLRHFPGWRNLFRECVRVLRPGGRLVFDMASGDQRAYMKAKGLLPEEEGEPFFDPVSFEVALTMGGLVALAGEHGLSVVATSPNDVLTANPLLDRVFGDEVETLRGRLRETLEQDEAIVLYELLARRFLPALSPCVSGSWVMVLEKRPMADPYRPLFDGARVEEAVVGPEGNAGDLMGILRAILGRRLGGYVREIARFAGAPEARALLDMLREEVLPRFPLDALYWQAEY